MIVTFNETQYEFKTFYSETNGHEIHLFRNDKLIEVMAIHELPQPPMLFDFYIGILKKYVRFESVKVHFK